jgi:hypothetical protein
MRAHRTIIEEWGGDAAVANALGAACGVSPKRVRFWRRRNSIPAEWWAALVEAGVTTLEELACAASRRREEGLVAVHGRTMAPDDTDGAENPERNVSRTNEPGLSAEGAAA